jgi:hypothetical protein
VAPVTAKQLAPLPTPQDSPSFSGNPDAQNLAIDVCGYYTSTQIASFTGWSEDSLTRIASVDPGGCGYTHTVNGATYTLSWAVQPASGGVVATLMSGGWGPVTPIDGLGEKAALVNQDNLGILVVIQGDRALIVRDSVLMSTARTNALRAAAAAGLGPMSR